MGIPFDGRGRKDPPLVPHEYRPLRHADCGGELVRGTHHRFGLWQCDRCRETVDIGVSDDLQGTYRPKAGWQVID